MLLQRSLNKNESSIENIIDAEIDNYKKNVLPGFVDHSMNIDEVQLERLLCAKSFREFIPSAWSMFDSAEFISGWHIDCIAEYMEAVYRGEIKHIIFNIPPRHMKSSIISVMFPAWVWIQDARKSFMCISYAESLSIRDSIKCRSLIQSRWFQDRWGEGCPDSYENPKQHRYKVILSDDQNQKKRFQNTQKGTRLSTSVCGSITGEGADFLLCDDPHNVLESESEAVRSGTVTWWKESVSSRLNNLRTGHKIIIQQRVHEKDLSGEMILTGDYEYVVLPMRYEEDHPYVFEFDKRIKDGDLLWPERFNEKEAKALESTMGEYAFAGQYQQRPSPRSGGAVKEEWFKIIKRKEVPVGGIIIRGWDLACSVGKDADWTVGATIKGIIVDKVMYFYVLRIDRFMQSAGATEKTILSIMERDTSFIEEENFPQDPGQSGKQQKRYLRIVAPLHPIRFSQESGSKDSRLIALASQIEIGNMYFVEGDWNEDLKKEFKTFPNGRWDDTIDAVYRAFSRLVFLLKSGDKRVIGVNSSINPQIISGSTLSPSSHRAFTSALSSDFFDRNSLINLHEDISLTSEVKHTHCSAKGRFLMPIEV